MSFLRACYFSLLASLFASPVFAGLPINPTPPSGDSGDVIQAGASWLKEILSIGDIALGGIVFLGVIIYLIIEFFNMRKNQHSGAGGGVGSFAVSVFVGVFILVFASFILNLAYTSIQTIGS